MEEKISKLITLLKKERVLITKMVESDEREDRLLFNELQKRFKEISNNTDNEINELIEKNNYDDLFKYIATKIDNFVEGQKNAQDYITLLGMINSTNLNKISENKVGFNSDVFTNELTSNIYNLYLWNLKEKDYSKEFVDSMRDDIVMKLVNSRALRKYFAGDYEQAQELSDSFLSYKKEERNEVGVLFVQLLGGQISLSNKFEMYDGVMDDISFRSRKELFKLEFCATSLMMMKHGFIIPVPPADYSDFTEELLTDASEMVNKFQNRNKEEQKKTINL